MFFNMSIPNCVPEYYRSLQDDYDHECELEMERQEWYNKNKEYRKQKYIEGCNEIMSSDECNGCIFGEEAMPDSEDDDMPTIICSYWKHCSVFAKSVNIPFDEYIKWREEYVEKLKKGEKLW